MTEPAAVRSYRIRVPRELQDPLERCADVNERSVTAQIKHALRSYLDAFTAECPESTDAMD